MEEINNGDKVTVRELYQLVDNKIGQVNSSIIRLENKFDNLESGRLAAIEQRQASIEGKMTIIPILISIAIGIFSFLLNQTVGR